MKNQYFGDAGDYGKYGLLRFIARDGIKIAVNWYLTEDDGSADGKHTKYLQDSKMAKYDGELFKLLGDMIGRGARDVCAFEKENAVPGAIYYHELLKCDKSFKAGKLAQRQEWHEEALKACADADLVFLDPDNGARSEWPKNQKKSIKYCFADEIVDYFRRGQDMVYYCSKGRRTDEQWSNIKLLLLRYLPDAKILVVTSHKGTQRSYVFVLHEESYHRYVQLLKQFVAGWDGYFTEEK